MLLLLFLLLAGGLFLALLDDLRVRLRRRGRTATAYSPRVTSVNLSPSWRSFTNSVSSSPSFETSTVNFSAMSSGRHSTSTERSTCSSTPPPIFTPTASPVSEIGTTTRTFCVSETSLKSTWMGVPLTTSFCISRMSAGISLPSMSRVTSSCLLVWPLRPNMNSCASSLTSNVPPLFIRITAAGILPARRRRRTAAEPCSARSSALILILSILVP